MNALLLTAAMLGADPLYPSPFWPPPERQPSPMSFAVANQAMSGLYPQPRRVYVPVPVPVYPRYGFVPLYADPYPWGSSRRLSHRSVGW